jgi:hypothetical protein
VLVPPAAADALYAETPVPQPTAPIKEVDPADLSPGLVGFLLFAGLAIAVVLLVLSMNRHLKKIDFDEDATAVDDPDSPRPGDNPTAG